MAAEVPPEEELTPPGDPESVARAICLRALTQRARTRAELAATLQRKGIPDEAARSVLDRFTEVGLIDDEALADTFAIAAHRERGLAGRAVATKLRQRGVAEPTVQAAVGQIDPESERSAARALVERRLRSLRGVDPSAQARRLVNLLARRGYPPGLAYQVVREALAGSGLTDPAEPLD
ncbi:MAG: regulatory protein RecX [Solirubrobacteraceae bacterium]